MDVHPGLSIPRSIPEDERQPHPRASGSEEHIQLPFLFALAWHPAMNLGLVPDVPGYPSFTLAMIRGGSPEAMLRRRWRATGLSPRPQSGAITKSYAGIDNRSLWRRSRRVTLITCRPGGAILPGRLSWVNPYKAIGELNISGSPEAVTMAFILPKTNPR